MRDKYCLPIIKATTVETLAILDEQDKNYRYFEIWLDYLTDASETFVKEVIKQWPNRIIFVFRRQQLAPMQLSLARRLAIIRLCHKQAVMVDLDLTSQKSELRIIADENLDIKTVLSHHDYSATPSQADLGRLARRMLALRPYILKIAAFCNSPDDCMRLLALSLRLQAEGQHCIILGMGEHGMATRIFGTLWANEMVFAPLTLKSQSAPGQLTRQQLDTINDILRKD